MKSEANHGQVISDYTRWLADRVAREPLFHAEVASLADQSLACHCCDPTTTRGVTASMSSSRPASPAMAYTTCPTASSDASA